MEKSIDMSDALCTIGKKDLTCPVENVRVSDTVSDPFISTVCIIVYCKNETTPCDADIDVEFYDQFAKPEKLRTYVLGMTFLDLFAWICAIVMVSVTAGIFYGLFGKYYPMFKERREEKEQKEKKQKDADKKDKMKKKMAKKKKKKKKRKKKKKKKKKKEKKKKKKKKKS